MKKQASIAKMIQAGLASWVIPGAGHFMLGHRALGAVFCSVITILFLTGLVVGGLKNSVNPLTNKMLFLAEMGMGGYTVTAYFVNLNVGEVKPADFETPEQRRQNPELYRKYVSFYPAADIAMIYLATAGLLNLLVILDAINRAQTGGLPTYYRHLPEAAPEEKKGGE